MKWNNLSKTGKILVGSILGCGGLILVSGIVIGIIEEIHKPAQKETSVQRNVDTPEASIIGRWEMEGSKGTFITFTESTWEVEKNGEKGNLQNYKVTRLTDSPWELKIDGLASIGTPLDNLWVYENISFSKDKKILTRTINISKAGYPKTSTIINYKYINSPILKQTINPTPFIESKTVQQPVISSPTVSSQPEKHENSVENIETTLRTFFNSWINDSQVRNYDISKYYADNVHYYSSENCPISKIIEDKNKFWIKYSDFKIQISNLELIKIDSNTFKFEYDKNFESTNNKTNKIYNGKVKSITQFKNIDNQWKIITEMDEKIYHTSNK